MKRVFTICLLLPVLSGCDYFCVDSAINPVFIGFSSADIDSAIVRRYQPNDNYLHLIDTFSLYKVGSIFTTTGDTTIVFINSGNPDQIIEEGYDWQIYLPGKNRTITIADIVSLHNQKYGAHGCLNPAISFVQDGQLVQPTYVNSGQFYTSGCMAYIHE